MCKNIGEHAPADMEDILDKLERMALEIRQNQDEEKRKEWMELLERKGYGRLHNNQPDNNELMEVFTHAINGQIEEKVSITNKEKILELLQKKEREKNVQEYLYAVDWEAVKRASSPSRIRRIPGHKCGTLGCRESYRTSVSDQMAHRDRQTKRLYILPILRQ